MKDILICSGVGLISVLKLFSKSLISFEYFYTQKLIFVNIFNYIVIPPFHKNKPQELILGFLLAMSL